MQGGPKAEESPAAARPDAKPQRLRGAFPDISSSTVSSSQRMALLARALERDVIPRLAAAHRLADHPEACNDARSVALSLTEVDSFARLVAGAPEARLSERLAELRARPLSVETILVDLFAPVARRLGELWADDECDFTGVTVGLGRLQRMMRELSPAFGVEVGHPPNGRRVLLVRAPGEQHTFGLSMVAEFFRRAGWEVVAGGAGADTDPITAVRREWFDAVGFSVGSEARLDWLPGCIAAVRSASCNRGLPILVGGPVFFLKPHLAREVGADASAPDGSEAPAVAESSIAGRVKRY